MTVVIVVLCVVVALVLLAAGGLAVFTGLAARKAETLVPPIGRFVTVDGVRLHYLDEGEGPPIVMLHGLASQMQSFTYALSERLRGSHRLILVDRPGSGYSASASAATLKEQARIVAGLMAQLGIGRALVVGHSLGGALALALAVDHPERVAGLALLAPATQAQSEPPPALKPLAIRSDLARTLVGWLLAVPASMRNRDRLLGALFKPDRIPEDFGTRGGALLLTRPSAFRAACRDLVEAGSEFGAYAARHGEIRVPVGVLFGDGDRILDHRTHGEGLRRQLPDVDLQLLEGGGHMIPLVRAEETAAFIERMAAKAGLAAEPKAHAG